MEGLRMMTHFIAITSAAGLGAAWVWSHVGPVVLFNHDPN